MTCPTCGSHAILLDWDDALMERILRCLLCSREVVKIKTLPKVRGYVGGQHHKSTRETA